MTGVQTCALPIYVERALEKLGEGTYGVCDVCGSEIGTERLEAIPWAVRCIDHAGGSR